MSDGSRRYEGAVLSTYERNSYHDSDFYAVVWDAESGTVEHVLYDSTRGYVNMAAEVDATPSAFASATAFLVERNRPIAREELTEAASAPRRGDVVRVDRKRAKANGRTGTVCWVGVDRFTGEPRVGVTEADGSRFFVPAAYVVVDEATVAARLAAVDDEADALARHRAHQATCRWTVAKAMVA
jgi:hypothetical protein